MERLDICEMTPHLLRERLAVAPVAYLPLGMIEDTGEHLPLGAGGFYAQGLLSALAREVGGVVLPTLYITPAECEGSHSPARTDNLFTTSEKVFDEVLKCIPRNLLRLGVRVLVIQGSPPAMVAIEQNRARWESESGLRILLVEPLTGEQESNAGKPHAIGIDTCLLMALCPDLVELRYLSVDRQEWPQGISGPDPRSSAYAERGERCLDEQVHSMAALLRQCLQDLMP